MKFDFIQVSTSILDYSEYVRSVLLLKNYIKHRFIEVLLEEGFKLEEEASKSYHSHEAVFYLANADLEVKLFIQKRAEEKFV